MSTQTFTPAEDALIFLPLGGTDEIGMNLSLYHYAGKWLMVDLGISFGDDSMPGIDVVMADPAFIEARRRDLVGLVLTHGHEDHIGAVPHLWPRLRCPIYATPFTASLLRRKLADADLLDEVRLQEIDLSANFVLGPFEIELLTLTHSIPEPNALVLRTGAGTVLHTGDWKFDPTPVIGDVADMAALRALGEDGVLALVGDSTNVFEPGHSGSERTVLEAFTRLFGEIEGRRIIVTCFASNVARLDSIARAAAANGRHTALVGRSLWRMHEVARENGLLGDLPAFLTPADAGYIPRDKLVLICTGSQGEPRAALSRIAERSHPEIVLEAGDTVIFSSREIPGNERAIGRLQSRLAEQGLEIVTWRERHVHVSGHPARDELAAMYQQVRPRIAVPVHGDRLHLMEHQRLARACQVPESVVPANGAAIRLAPGPAAIIGHVPTGTLALDGGRLRPLDGATIRDRRQMLHNGNAMVTLVLDRRGEFLAEPVLGLRGLAETGELAGLHEDGAAEVRAAVERLPPRQRRDDARVEAAAGSALRRLARRALGKRPVTSVHLVRV